MQGKEVMGATVKDVITGFSGIVTAHATYITGCDQYLVQPVMQDGKFEEPRWIDGDRLNVLQIAPVVLARRTANGCDKAAPIR